jgi:hypothetical protein
MMSRLAGIMVILKKVSVQVPTGICILPFLNLQSMQIAPAVSVLKLFPDLKHDRQVREEGLDAFRIEVASRYS